MTSKIEVIDLASLGFQFGFTGVALKKAINRKKQAIEESITDLMNQIERELGTDTKQITTLLVAVRGDTDGASVKVKYIQSLCDRVNLLTEERSRLMLLFTGVGDADVYRLNEEQMKLLGLG